MPDVFDQVAGATSTPEQSAPAEDVFDRVAKVSVPKGDVFDRVAATPSPKGDVFDRVAPTPKPDVFDQISASATAQPAPTAPVAAQPPAVDNITPQSEAIANEANRRIAALPPDMRDADNRAWQTHLAQNGGVSPPDKPGPDVDSQIASTVDKGGVLGRLGTKAWDMASNVAASTLAAGASIAQGVGQKAVGGVPNLSPDAPVSWGEWLASKTLGSGNPLQDRAATAQADAANRAAQSPQALAPADAAVGLANNAPATPLRETIRNAIGPTPEQLPPPQGAIQKYGVDLPGNILQMAGEIGLQKNVLPESLANGGGAVGEAARWEVQNQAAGGTPGTGAVMGGTMGAIGEVLPKQPVKAAIASGLALGTATYLTTGKLDEALVNALVPSVLQTPRVFSWLHGKLDGASPEERPAKIAEAKEAIAALQPKESVPPTDSPANRPPSTERPTAPTPQSEQAPTVATPATVDISARPESEIPSPVPDKQRGVQGSDQTIQTPTPESPPANPPQARPLPQNVPAEAVSSPESTAPATSAKPSLYSENGPERASRILDPKSQLGTNESVWASANRDLAKGQGDNRGVTIEFDTDKVRTTDMSGQKPGLQVTGDKELAVLGQSGELSKLAKSVTIDPEVAKGPFVGRLKNILAREGWTGEAGDDGKIVYTREGAATPPAEPVKPGTAAAEPPTESGGTTGIAQRVTETRGTAAQPGQGISPDESVSRGRELLKGGADPSQVVADFEKNGKLSGDSVAVARAHLETLSKAANAAADKNGINSPEYKAAFKAETDWVDRIKPMQTEWHKIGQAQQGETEIDTGTFHGLNRAYRDISGKDFTPAQARTAGLLADKVKGASGEVDATAQKLSDAIDAHVAASAADPRTKSLADRIVEKLDKAANDALARFKARQVGTVRSGIDPADLADLSIYGAAKIAKGLTRFSEWSADMVKDIGESIRPHLQTIWDASDKKLDEHIASNSPKSAAQKISDAIRKPPVDIAAHPPGTKMTPDRVAALWKYAKENYIDQGNNSLPDIANKLSTDFGLPVSDIRRALAEPKSLRNITNDMYAAQARRRAVTQQAKQWVNNAATPGIVRFAKGIPGAFFSAKVFGHGTVGMITHAGNQMFNPMEVGNYWTNFARQFKIVSSSAYHERMMQELSSGENYTTARRAGLANDPGVTEEYQGGLLGKLGVSGSRGFDALKLFRQDMFDRGWNGLPESLKNQQMAKELATSINHATGYGANPLGTGGAGKVASAAFFAPELEGSRWAFLVGDPAKAAYRLANWKNEPPEFRASAISEVKQKAAIAATYLGVLAANQALLKASGSKDKINFTDPTSPDWLSFKAFGHNVGVAGPMINSVKFLTNIGRAMVENQKALGGKSRSDAVADEMKRYLRGKLSPFSSVAADIAFQSDYQGRPMPFSSDKVPAYLRNEGVGKIGYGEYAAQAVLPIPAEEAVKEVWRSKGVDEPTINKWMRAIGIAAVTGGTGARVTDATKAPVTSRDSRTEASSRSPGAYRSPATPRRSPR